MPYPPAQIPSGRVNQKATMISHEAIGMTLNSKPVSDFTHQIQEYPDKQRRGSLQGTKHPGIQF